VPVTRTPTRASTTSVTTGVTTGVRAAVLGSTLAVVLLATLGTLLAAVLLKSACLTDWTPGAQPKSCYNDIQALWHARDMGANVPPYSGEVREVVRDGEVVRIDLGQGQIEYPVVTGVFAWVTALPAWGHTSYWVISALALTPFAFASSWALARLSGRRALLFAASPQLAAYAYLNWDLLPAAATVLAIWAWRRDRQTVAAVLLALGACAKIYPGFLLLPLVLHLLYAGRRVAAVRVVVASVATVLVVNLPFALTNPTGWAAPFRMQSLRVNDATTNSLWFAFGGGVPLGRLNLYSAAAVLLAWTVVCLVGYRAAVRGGDYPWLQVGAAMVTSYIVLGRVDSPQYGLWVLPFLVVVAVPRRWLVAFVVSDLWMWFEWSWLWGTPHLLHVIAPIVRALVLVGLTVVLLRSPLRLSAQTDELLVRPGPSAGRAAAPATAPTPAPHR